MIKTPPTHLGEVFDLLHPKFVQAIVGAHDAYERLGIRHALIGGLAVGIHGHPRATKDVDFLVGPEAFESSGLIVSFRAGVPLASGGVAVDSVPIPEGYESIFERALAEAKKTDDVPVIGLPYLVLMKLMAGRRQDLADVAAIVSKGDLKAVRALVDEALPSASATLEQLIAGKLAEAMVTGSHARWSQRAAATASGLKKRGRSGEVSLTKSDGADSGAACLRESDAS